MSPSEATSSDVPVAGGKRVLFVSALLCYVLALPFEVIVLWSAVQVLAAGASHVADQATLRHIWGIALAQAHPIPFAIAGSVSLAIGIGGASLHLRYRRANG
jgi:hypothetical protein